MTNREEIERLLNQTGRTLEGLPDDYGDEKLKVWRSFRDGEFGHVKSFEMANQMLHQSDVIELLIGALRDALEKPNAIKKKRQKPMALVELMQKGDVWAEYLTTNEIEHVQILKVTDESITIEHKDGSVVITGVRYYGKSWIAWATRPTKEERLAAK